MTVDTFHPSSHEPSWVAPDMVLRVAALPVETLDALKDTTLTTLLRHWLQAEARIHRERDAISSALFESIGEQQAPEGRRILLRLRRSLYNTRTVRGPDLDAASQFLAPDVLDLVHQAVARIEAHQDARRSLAIMHDEGLVAARRHVHQKILTPSFLHGLALSSRTLYRNVARYGDPASSRGARFEQVERGLLRYLSRASRKATPYARFCSVIGGTFDDPDECRAGSEAWSTFDGDPTAQRGYLRIDKKLFARLWAHLKSVNGVRGALVVALNSTLRRNGDSWTFLAAPRWEGTVPAPGPFRGIGCCGACRPHVAGDFAPKTPRPVDSGCFNRCDRGRDIPIHGRPDWNRVSLTALTRRGSGGGLGPATRRLPRLDRRLCCYPRAGPSRGSQIARGPMRTR
jgi:hypothetical protein